MSPPSPRRTPAAGSGPALRSSPRVSLQAKLLLGALVLLGAALGASFLFHQSFLWAAAIVLALFLILTYAIARRASRDLAVMASAAQAIGRGEAGPLLPIHRRDEIGDLARTLDVVGARLRETLPEVTEERNRLKAILEGMGDGVLVTDGDGRVVLVNAALKSLIDLPEDPAGRKILELVRTPDLHALVTEGLAGGTDLSGEILLRHGVTERRVLVRIERVEDPGSPPGMVAVFHDITEMRRLEQMRRDFVANVSHELKTPLTAVRGYAETLADTPPGDPLRAKSFLETIVRNAQRLSLLVEDLLELSRIESGEMVLHPIPVDLRAILERVVQALEPAAIRRRVSLSIVVPADLPPVSADPGALETVLSNLVENAVKYVSEGGRVEVRARRLDRAARIEIADSGPGISPEHLPRIFERFYRVDPSRSREQGGTGLGLAIVKHLTQALGGQAEVQSELGRGSVFSVVLPLSAERLAR